MNTLQLKMDTINPELIGVRDKWIQQIEDQIKTKKQLLLEKRKYLEQTKEENRYLEGVKQDYEKYKNHIVREKQEQLMAMEIIKRYTERIKQETKLTKERIDEWKEDQNKILSEIDAIKQGLDDLIE